MLNYLPIVLCSQTSLKWAVKELAQKLHLHNICYSCKTQLNEMIKSFYVFLNHVLNIIMQSKNIKAKPSMLSSIKFKLFEIHVTKAGCVFFYFLVYMLVYQFVGLFTTPLRNKNRQRLDIWYTASFRSYPKKNFFFEKLTMRAVSLEKLLSHGDFQPLLDCLF